MADSSCLVNVVFDADISNAQLTKWKVKAGSHISQGTVLLLYDDGVTGPKKWKAPRDGTITELVAREGDNLHNGCVLMSLVGCLHPIIMKDMCADCGADLRENKEEQNESFASVAMVHSVPELRVSKKQAQILGRADEQRLFKSRKLVLLVDLDQTLIHTTNDNVPPKIKDVHHFQLYGAHSPWYHARLRPGTKEFLDKVERLFELHICTFGARLYAHTVANILDKDGRYFSHRILSRDECFSANSKTANLKALFPCGDNMVVIIDDREDVWNFAPNVVHVKPYHFFQHTGDINAPPGMTKTECDGGEEEGSARHRFVLGKRVKRKSQHVPKTETTATTDNEPTVAIKTQPDSGICAVTCVQASTDPSLSEALLVQKNVSEVPNTKPNDGLVGKPEAIDATVKDDAMETDDLEEKGASLKKDVESNINDEDVGTNNEDNGDVGTNNEDNGDVGTNNEDIVDVGTNNEDIDDVGTNNKDDVKTGIVKDSANDDDDGLNLATDLKLQEKEGTLEMDVDNQKDVPDSPKALEQQAEHHDDHGTNNKDNKTGIVKDNTNDDDGGLNLTSDLKLQKKEDTPEMDVDDSPKALVQQTEHRDAAEVEKGFSSSDDDEEIEVEDNDDYLLYLSDILANIHRRFYDAYDQAVEAGGVIPDMKLVIPQVRRRILRGVRLVFSGVIPTNLPMEKSRAFYLARSMGAEIQSHLVTSGARATTHVVAARLGTVKVNEARRVRGLCIVTPAWLWSCAERWERVDESIFPLTKESSGKDGHLHQMMVRPAGAPTYVAAAKTVTPPVAAPQSVQFPTYDSVTGKRVVIGAPVKSKSQAAPAATEVPATPSAALVNFAESINPLMAFSSEDIAKMDREVEDLLEDSDEEEAGGDEVGAGDNEKGAGGDERLDDNDSDDESPNLKRKRSPGRGEMESGSSSAESLSGDNPRGWRKSRTGEGDHDDGQPAPKYPRGELPEDSDRSAPGGSSTDGESVGSVDEEMAAAVEREFLGM